LGKPLTEHLAGFVGHTRELEHRSKSNADQVPPPRLQRGQSVPWPDLLRFVNALLGLLRDRADPFERRMRKCLALARLCRQARFDQITGGRLVEFLNLAASSLDADVSPEPSGMPPPTRITRVLFRQLLAVYARKDLGPDRSLIRGRIGLPLAAWRFIRGTGSVPRLHAWIPVTTFEQIEAANAPIPPLADEVLERYYTVKLSSLQFCGSAHFGFGFWEGFQDLALTLPVILWLVRALKDLPGDEAVARAIGIVDRNYGFNRVLATRRHRLAMSVMCRGDELERLINWYSRQ
jgi:lysine-N-methylase